MNNLFEFSPDKRQNERLIESERRDSAAHSISELFIDFNNLTKPSAQLNKKSIDKIIVAGVLEGKFPLKIMDRSVWRDLTGFFHVEEKLRSIIEGRNL